MSILVFLVGLYVLPVVLLAWGHKIRRLSPRKRRAFWGAVIGHCVAGTLALFAGMLYPEEWSAQETVRGFFGLWALLLFPMVGAALGAAMAPSRA